MGFDSGKELVEARRLEDTNAFAGYTGSMKQLDFLERAYVTPPQRQQDQQRIKQLIEDWVAEDPKTPSCIFVPAGAGVPMPPPVWRKIKREKVVPVASGISEPLVVESADIKPEVVVPVTPSTQAKIKTGLKNLVRGTLHQIESRRRRFYQSKGVLANEDHVALRDIVLENFADRANVSLGLYDEYPYAWSRSAKAWVAKNLPAATA